MKARKILHAIAIIAAVLAALAGEIRALPPRTAPSAQVEQKPDSKISVESALVNLDVLVTDQDGRVLAGLKRENFRVLDDGKPQSVTHFEPTSAPITIAMLMEYSGSAYNYYANKASSWGSNFLNYLDPLDWVALVTYDIKPTVKLDFTRNKSRDAADAQHPVLPAISRGQYVRRHNGHARSPGPRKG